MHFASVLITMFLIAGVSQAQIADEGLPNPFEIAKVREERARAESGISRSLVPIAGYNPTYRIFVGGGFFWERSPDLGFGINGIVTQGQVFKVETDLSVRNNRWTYRIHDEIGKGFEPNYGAGPETRTSDRVDLKLFKNMFQVEANWYAGMGVSIGPLIDYKLRRNFSRPGDPTLSGSRDPYDPREDSWGLGLVERWDLRDNPTSPRYGWFQTFKAIAFPADLQLQHASYTQLQSEVRLFQFLFDPEIVFAFQLVGGVTFGVPSYLNEYKLGGTDYLRGYLENRFRGKRFYNQQNEMRFPIYKALGGVAFMEFGEASNEAFSHPSMSYGAGVRIGLPPDYISKIRVDFAIGRDQRGVFFDFGQAF